jgi:hypothetical protein
MHLVGVLIATWLGGSAHALMEPVPEPLVRAKPVEILVRPDGSAQLVSGQPCQPRWSAMGHFYAQEAFKLAALPDGHLMVGVWAGVAVWNGRSWSGINARFEYYPTGPFVVRPDGVVYVGGRIDSRYSSNYVHAWDGRNLTALLSGPDRWVGAMTLAPNGDLIVGGSFTRLSNGSGAMGVARWNGSVWFHQGMGPNGAVRALAILQNGDLVAGGEFTMNWIVPTPYIAVRTNGVWETLGGGTDGPVRVLKVHTNGDLIAGGWFASAGGEAAANAARWDGMRWWPLGSGPGGPVDDLVVLPDGSIVAAVSSPGGPGIVQRWDGSVWSPLGLGFDGEVRALAVLSNGDLIAGGSFRHASGVRAGGVARWGCVCRGDFNGDGIVDFNDVLAFLNAFNASGPEADMDGDGVIDFNDFLAFLNRYNAGC